MDPTNTHGAFSWNELTTADVEGAKQFYGEMFGWTYEEMPTDDGSLYIAAMLGDTPMGGIMARPDSMPEHIPSFWGSYVTVDDVDAAVEKAKALGGHVALEPLDITGVGRLAVIIDPQGAALSLITYAKR